MMALESRPFLQFGPTSGFQNGLISEDYDERVNPVITGLHIEPETEQFVWRVGKNAGDGDYYRYRSKPNVEKYSTRMKIGPYPEQIFSSSMDVKWKTLIAEGTSTEETRAARYYSNGIFAYITWFSSYTHDPSSSRCALKWWRYVGQHARGSQTLITYDLYDSQVKFGYSYDQWEAFYLEHLHDLPIGRSSLAAWQGSFSQSSGERKASYPGYEAFASFEELGELPRNYELVAASAYLDQATRLPVAATNSIANVLEYSQIVAALIHRDFSGISSLLQPKNAWLAYRYSYTTTKLDMHEYVELTRRLTNLVNSDVVTSHGYASSGSAVCKCTAHYDPSSLIPSGTKKFLEQYGLKLSLINMWDMLPYSFVVDWFFHIGSFLQDLEDRSNMLTLTPLDVWYSFSDYTDASRGYYFRIKDRPHYNAPYVGPSPASEKTTLMRVADAISLFT